MSQERRAKSQKPRAKGQGPKAALIMGKMPMPRLPLRVVVLHNTCGEQGRPARTSSVRGVLDEAAAVARACRALGWTVEVLPAPEDPCALLHALAAARPDVVFNLVEEYQGRAEGEAHLAALLELSGLPYTGSPPAALALSLDKPLAKAILRSHAIPVPRGVLLEAGDEPLSGLCFPCIVKLSRADASEGLTLESVVGHETAARARARLVRKRYGQAALVEEFIAGREFEVALLGEGEHLTEMPLAELDYTDFPQGAPRLMTYNSKWTPGSAEYRGTRNVAPRGVPKATVRRMFELARASYRILGLRDYGRVDLRLGAAKAPVVLEVNPNPDVAPGAALATALERGGIAYTEFVRRTVCAALTRGASSSRGREAGCQPVLQRVPRHSAPDTRHSVLALRPLKASDRGALEGILRATQHFSEEEIEVALELIDDGLRKGKGKKQKAKVTNGAGHSALGLQHWPVSPQGYCFIVAEVNDCVTGYVCFGRTPFTDGVYDMYWIGVDPARQGQGVGRALAEGAEHAALVAGGRLMVAETASKRQYAGTRLFYERAGYREEARLRDFYAAGDDKILYLKRLGQ